MRRRGALDFDLDDRAFVDDLRRALGLRPMLLEAGFELDLEPAFQDDSLAPTLWGPPPKIEGGTGGAPAAP